MPGTIQIVPVGKIAKSLAIEVADILPAVFDLQAVAGAPLGEPKYAFNEDRKQFHAAAILRRLCAARTKEQVGILGVTELDLFDPDTPFIYGDADRESRSAILSLARLRPEFHGAVQDLDRLRNRARSEVAHVVGHLVGLSHCEDSRCVMFSSVVASDADRKSRDLCSNCRAELSRVAQIR